MAAQIELESTVAEAVKKFEVTTGRRCYSLRVDHSDGGLEVDASTCGPSHRQPARVLSRAPDR